MSAKASILSSRFPRPDGSRKLAAEVAHKLLANPVIESYRIEVAE